MKRGHNGQKKMALMIANHIQPCQISIPLILENLWKHCSTVKVMMGNNEVYLQFQTMD